MKFDPMTNSVSDVCQHVYEDTAKFYEQIAPNMGESAYGYKILYGPPSLSPPLLTLALQPGGGQNDASGGPRCR